MLDRAGVSDDLFRFSTTPLQWEQLDVTRVSGSPPSARQGHAMVAVGNDLIVFGGETDSGEETRCACRPPSGVMSDIVPTIAPRAATLCACAAAHGVERVCRDCRHQGLVVTRGTAQQLYPVTVSRSGHTNKHVHNVSSMWCTGGAV